MTWVDKNLFPFTAVVGQDDLKLALILNAVNPRIGGVLIRGEKGTAKSTTVRALAGLLPQIKARKGCAYACDPDLPHEMCHYCREQPVAATTLRRPARMVTLPLNATEDRVVGGLDLDLAIKSGIRALEPGLLAGAHRGILYVDEVNLLDDNLVDIILDTAAAGENRVEREGISDAHSSRFILVGTMNPEEGELRPQLLDRFGFCVAVGAESELDKRVLMMQRREVFDADSKILRAQFESENLHLTQRIAKGRELLGDVELAAELRSFIAELGLESQVAGHRADLVIEQGAKTLAAYQGRFEVTIEDIRKIAPLALEHRRREAAPPPEAPQQSPEQHQEPDQQTQEKPDKGAEPPPQQSENSQDTTEADPQSSEPENSTPDSTDLSPDERREETTERIFEVGSTFKVKKITTAKDRAVRRGSGRRSRTRVAERQGRYVKSTIRQETGDFALDATLRAAAPYQRRRPNPNGLAITLWPQDMREKIREKRIGNFLLFVVDASGSMGAQKRMVAAKGAIMSLLLDAYQKRDQVAMVSFRKTEAHLQLPPTASIELAANLLQEMPVGGRTPLSAGLVKSYEVLRNHLSREPTARPIVVIITDGKANSALGDQKPVDEAIELAAKMAFDDRVQYVVVDTENTGLVRFGLAGKLADSLKARYFPVAELKTDSLIDIVKGGI